MSSIQPDTAVTLHDLFHQLRVLTLMIEAVLTILAPADPSFAERHYHLMFAFDARERRATDETVS